MLPEAPPPGSANPFLDAAGAAAFDNPDAAWLAQAQAQAVQARLAVAAQMEALARSEAGGARTREDLEKARLLARLAIRSAALRIACSDAACSSAYSSHVRNALDVDWNSAAAQRCITLCS